MLNNIDLTEILHLYVDEKLSTYQIGERLGISPATVRHRLKKMDLCLRGCGELKKTSLSEETLQEIKRLHLSERLSTCEISRRTDIPPSTVRKKLNGYFAKSQGSKSRAKK